jgi:hypothetical protein
LLFDIDLNFRPISFIRRPDKDDFDPNDDAVATVESSEDAAIITK